MKYIMYRISIADYTYIGSTKDFKQRKNSHKQVCNNVNNPIHNLKVYQMIRENGGWDKCEMIPIEECECENNTQARIREEYWRREYDAKINSRKAFTIHNPNEYNTIYYNNNKEKEKERQRKYYNLNKDAILNKATNKHICECGGSYTHHKSTHLKTKKHCDYINSLAVEATV